MASGGRGRGGRGGGFGPGGGGFGGDLVPKGGAVGEAEAALADRAHRATSGRTAGSRAVSSPRARDGAQPHRPRQGREPLPAKPNPILRPRQSLSARP